MYFNNKIIIGEIKIINLDAILLLKMFNFANLFTSDLDKTFNINIFETK